MVVTASLDPSEALKLSRNPRHSTFVFGCDLT
jgi:hypothetical protein